MTKQDITKLAHELLETEEMKQAQASRENQQILIYIFVSLIIIAAWVLGYFQASFLWIFFLILLTFVVWWAKVLRLTEAHIKHCEIQIHRKKALRQFETAEWMNFILNRWWVFCSNSISDIIKRKLDPVLFDIKPNFLDAIELLSISLGSQTPFVKYVHVYEYIDGALGGKKPMSWSTVVTPPIGLVQAQQYQVVIEADVGLTGDNFTMIFRTVMKKVTLDMAVEKLNIAGKMQFVLHLDMDTPFPHVSTVTASFLEKPEVWFSVRVLKSIQMMDIPIMKTWLHHLVMDGLTQAFVDPSKVDINFLGTGPTKSPSSARSKANAHGVLTVTVKGDEVKGNVRLDGVRYCQLRIGDQREHTRHMTTLGAWQDHCSFLIEDLHKDKLCIKSKTKVLLSNYTIAQFDVPLADFLFEHQHSCHTVLEDKSNKFGGIVHLELELEYTVLPPVENIIEREEVPPPVDEVAGLMYVCMHSANNLLGLDRNGLSDPYCVLFSNGKKIKTTHYVSRTKNPTWEVSAEYTVADFTKAMLSFIVYDWDGSSTSEDDFLGSAHIMLSKDESFVIHNNLNLGCNLLDVGQADNPRLGSITVSVIFRPVPSVAKSEDSSVSKTMHPSPTISRTKQIASRIDASESKKKMSSFGDDKFNSMGLDLATAQGHDILELQIIQAKDLVAMDLNGFSDPYVDVKIDGERKFTTSVKKKTLTPIWNEFVTMQLPNVDEKLELIVWDKDVFFSKDFLGSLKLSVEDLKKYSQDSQHDGWFSLYRIHSGQIQLKINIVPSDPGSVQFVDGRQEPVVDSCPSPDSGVPTSPSMPSDNETMLITPPSVNVNYAFQELAVEIPTLGSDTITSEHGDGKEETSKSGSSAQETNIYFNDTRNTFPGAKSGRMKDLPRSSSFSKMQDNSQVSPHSDYNENMTHTKEKLSKRFRRAISLNSLALHRPIESASAKKYYGIKGEVNTIKGLRGTSSSLYCKIRFDNRSEQARKRKLSLGHVIAKSNVVKGWTDANFELQFEVDPGYGVLMESALTFHIKKSSNSVLAAKTITLKEILEGHTHVTKWLPLSDSLELEVKLQHTNNMIAATYPRRRKLTQRHETSSLNR